MKTIRYMATILLLAAGVLHFFLFMQEPWATGSAVVLAFRNYLFCDRDITVPENKIFLLAGIIFPLIGIIVGLSI